MELGGFAEFEKDIDGDFNSFNYCLSEEYAGAIMEEDFEALGTISNYLLDNIIYWLNYDNKRDCNLEVIKGIDKGDIITVNNRTFIEAIIDCHQHQMAETYIDRGNLNPKLYLTCMLYGDNETIINNVHYYINNREEYIQFLNNLFNEIELAYNKTTEQNKIQFLNKIKPAINEIRYPIEYEKISIKTDKYNWAKQYKK